jgi:hypothetical protein
MPTELEMQKQEIDYAAIDWNACYSVPCDEGRTDSKSGENPYRMSPVWSAQDITAHKSQQQTGMAWCVVAVMWILLAFTLYLVWLKLN